MAGTVVVACKLPNGLKCQLRNEHGRIKWEQTLVGGRFKRHQQTGMPISDGREIVGDGMDGGFGLTYGVDADAFNEWMATYAEYQPVKAGLIFAHSRSNEVAAQARDKAELRSGLEPADPKRYGLEAMDKAA